MIRLASEQEAIEILNEPQNIERIGLVSEHMKYQPWLIEDGDYKIMFVFWHIKDKTFEIHIAASSNAIRKSRELTRKIMNWMFIHGAERITTTCPKGKISNFAIKIGMTPYKTDEETTYFEALSWIN